MSTLNELHDIKEIWKNLDMTITVCITVKGELTDRTAHDLEVSVIVF